MYRSEVCIEICRSVRLPIRAIDRIGRRFAELVAAENSAMIAARKLVNRGISSEMGGYGFVFQRESLARYSHGSRLLTPRAITNTFANSTGNTIFIIIFFSRFMFSRSR